MSAGDTLERWPGVLCHGARVYDARSGARHETVRSVELRGVPVGVAIERGDEFDRIRPSGVMRADAYLIVAAGHRLHAATLEELAEIAQCALLARDPIESLGAHRTRGWRPLRAEELGRFAVLLTARLD
jgi:hypothetical protein